MLRASNPRLTLDWVRESSLLQIKLDSESRKGSLEIELGSRIPPVDGFSVSDAYIQRWFEEEFVHLFCEDIEFRKRVLECLLVGDDDDGSLQARKARRTWFNEVKLAETQGVEVSSKEPRRAQHGDKTAIDLPSPPPPRSEDRNEGKTSRHTAICDDEESCCTDISTTQGANECSKSPTTITTTDQEGLMEIAHTRAEGASPTTAAAATRFFEGKLTIHIKPHGLQPLWLSNSRLNPTPPTGGGGAAAISSGPDRPEGSQALAISSQGHDLSINNVNCNQGNLTTGPCVHGRGTQTWKANPLYVPRSDTDSSTDSWQQEHFNLSWMDDLENGKMLEEVKMRKIKKSEDCCHSLKEVSLPLGHNSWNDSEPSERETQALLPASKDVRGQEQSLALLKDSDSVRLQEITMSNRDKTREPKIRSITGIYAVWPDDDLSFQPFSTLFTIFDFQENGKIAAAEPSSSPRHIAASATKSSMLLQDFTTNTTAGALPSVMSCTNEKAEELQLASSCTCGAAAAAPAAGNAICNMSEAATQCSSNVERSEEGREATANLRALTQSSSSSSNTFHAHSLSNLNQDPSNCCDLLEAPAQIITLPAAPSVVINREDEEKCSALIGHESSVREQNVISKSRGGTRAISTQASLDTSSATMYDKNSKLCACPHQKMRRKTTTTIFAETRRVNGPGHGHGPSLVRASKAPRSSRGRELWTRLVLKKCKLLHMSKLTSGAAKNRTWSHPTVCASGESHFIAHYEDGEEGEEEDEQVKEEEGEEGEEGEEEEAEMQDLEEDLEEVDFDAYPNLCAAEQIKSGGGKTRVAFKPSQDIQWEPPKRNIHAITVRHGQLMGTIPRAAKATPRRPAAGAILGLSRSHDINQWQSKNLKFHDHVLWDDGDTVPYCDLYSLPSVEDSQVVGEEAAQRTASKISFFDTAGSAHEEGLGVTRRSTRSRIHDMWASLFKKLLKKTVKIKWERKSRRMTDLHENEYKY